MNKVLIIDSSKSVRNNLCERLQFEGFDTISAADPLSGRELASSIDIDIVICDSLCDCPLCSAPFIVVSNNPTLELAISAVRAGARDLITKPIDMNQLLHTIRAILPEHSEVGALPPPPRRVSRMRRVAATPEIVGTSPQISRLRTLIEKVAKCDARVLITGENGTGKELVARWLHALSNRSESPFVEVNCAAIPSELIESELFGHEKGAFTSAFKARKGKFELADTGTLFMDEVGDMSLSAQAKVLRALQEKRITRVGGDKNIEVDVRVVAATNKDLKSEIAKGNFREDLYHRLGVVLLKVPPLRDREGDIPLLVETFINQICGEYHITPKIITPEAIKALNSMPWSGNIRELRNVVERLVILSEEQIDIHDIEQYG